MTHCQRISVCATDDVPNDSHSLLPAITTWQHCIVPGNKESFPELTDSDCAYLMDRSALSLFIPLWRQMYIAPYYITSSKDLSRTQYSNSSSQGTISRVCVCVCVVDEPKTLHTPKLSGWKSSWPTNCINSKAISVTAKAFLNREALYHCRCDVTSSHLYPGGYTACEGSSVLWRHPAEDAAPLCRRWRLPWTCRLDVTWLPGSSDSSPPEIKMGNKRYIECPL